MKRAALIVLFALATSLGHGRELTPLAGSPQWRVGDTWHVLTRTRRYGPDSKTGEPVERRRKKPVRVSYEVTGIVAVDGERCFEIEMTRESRPGHAWVYALRVRDLTVKRLVEREGERRVNAASSHPPRPFVFPRESALCPLDLPLFPTDPLNERPWVGRRGFSSAPLTQEHKWIDDGKALLIRLTSRENGKVVKSVQRWEAGRPWWTEAKRFVDGKLVEEGRLDR